MSDADMTLPPVPVIGAALRKTTQRIAHEVATPGAQAPDWSNFEWRVAMAAAVMHGVSALLAKRLRWRGPPVWEAFLAEQRHQGRLRQRRIVDVLAQVDRAAIQADLACVGLKGSALLGLGLYRAGERPMADIDLLLRGEDLEAAAQMLKALAYVEGIATWKHRIFIPASMPEAVEFGEHADNPIKIELHARIVEHLPVRDTEITSQVLTHQARAGLNPYPSERALMRHLLLHTAGNLQSHSVRLIQLHDIALLAARLGSDDWQGLLADGADGRGLWWALPPLALVDRCFPNVIAREVLQRLEADCPVLLRRSSRRHGLADVSLSKIRIPAFPGIEWSRSPAEAVSFMAQRMFPDREARSLGRRLCAAQPSLSASDWAGRSQFGKVLRWVFSQAPRAQTIYTVRRALAYEPA